MRGVVGQRLRRLALTIVAVAACGEYAHTNPYEPGANVTISVLGPDTITALAKLAQFTYSATPPLPGANPAWESDAPSVLQPAGEGFFRSADNGTAVIRVTVGPHTGSKTVVVRQQLDHLVICLNIAGCDSPYRLGSADRTITLVPVDANSAALKNPVYPPIGSMRVAVRNPAVAQATLLSPAAFAVKPLGIGQTFAVLTVGSRSDSVAVVVVP
jgi:hypothetical protein